MSLVDDLVERLSSSYQIEPLGVGRFLLAAHHGRRLEPEVVLYVEERAFAEYLAELARTCESGDIDAALGLVEIHIDEEVDVERPSPVTDLGVRARGPRRGRWFAESRVAVETPSRAHTAEPHR